MVTKLVNNYVGFAGCSVLAKIHMVTKPRLYVVVVRYRSVLAKIHMVTKRRDTLLVCEDGSVLAKIHMVTKLSNISYRQI